MFSPTPCARYTLAILNTLLLTLLVGCDAVMPSSDTSTDGTTALTTASGPSPFENKTRAELLQLIAESATDVEQTQKLYQTSGGDFRLKNMQARTQEQIEAWTYIEKLPDASPAEQQEAIVAQVKLLSRATDSDWAGFSDLLMECRDRVVAEYPGSEGAARADAAVIWQEHLRTLGDGGTTAAAVVQHAKSYSESVTGPVLYARFASLLFDAKQSDQAKEICRLAAERYSNEKLLAPIHQVLRNIRNAEAAEQQRLAVLNMRARQFGGHYDGYFVLFLRPKNLKFMSTVEYIVAHGLDEAIKVTEGAEAWDLEGWFPETKQGMIQADELATQLQKKNTISVPTWQ